MLVRFTPLGRARACTHVRHAGAGSVMDSCVLNAPGERRGGAGGGGGEAEGAPNEPPPERLRPILTGGMGRRVNKAVAIS
mmetsp:Transcript_10956/g.28290  ORF Transcript_10956/g.28290 Transcript_10956/m.28290 type:complete len:80 (+) Transcript_10956:561-800(+)